MAMGLANSSIVTHRGIFCEHCKEETLWFPDIGFDTRSAMEPVIIARCCECGNVKKASTLTEYDRQIRYLFGDGDE